MAIVPPGADPAPAPPSPAPPSPAPPSPAYRLPECLWEKIFSFLPVSSLIVARTVCRSWNEAISSEMFSSLYVAAAPLRGDLVDDVYFLLFADMERASPFAAAYRPSVDRWVPFPLSRFFGDAFGSKLCRVLASDGALILAERDDAPLLVCNFFSGKSWEIPPAIFSHGYVLGLIDEGPSEFQIVSVKTVDRVLSQVFKSTTGEWTCKGQLSGQFAVLGNSAYLDGILYTISRTPDHLLAFNLQSGDWGVVNVAMPSAHIVCSHILVYAGSLVLIAGLEEAGDICKIALWKLDAREERWEDFGCMPEKLLQEFRNQRLHHFYTVDRRGLICFCNTSSFLPLMCDLRGMRWWRPRRCPFDVPENWQTWFGHALEPHVGVQR